MTSQYSPINLMVYKMCAINSCGNLQRLTCGHATTKQASLISWNLRSNLHSMGYIYHCILSEARHPQEMVQNLTIHVSKSASAIPRHIRGIIVLKFCAKVALLRLAVSAFIAIRQEHRQHCIPHYKFFYMLSHTFNNTITTERN